MLWYNKPLCCHPQYLYYYGKIGLRQWSMAGLTPAHFSWIQFSVGIGGIFPREVSNSCSVHILAAFLYWVIVVGLCRDNAARASPGQGSRNTTLSWSWDTDTGTHIIHNNQENNLEHSFSILCFVLNLLSRFPVAKMTQWSKNLSLRANRYPSLKLTKCLMLDRQQRLFLKFWTELVQVRGGVGAGPQMPGFIIQIFPDN